MSNETFNPIDPEYKKVADLPENKQDEFVDDGDGFVQKGNVADIGRARAMAEAGDELRSVESFYRQVVNILDKHGLVHAGDKVSQDVEAELRDIVHLHPNPWSRAKIGEGPMTHLVGDKDEKFAIHRRKGHLAISRNEAITEAKKYGDLTEKQEYWKGYLHNSPNEELNIENIIKLEEDIRDCEIGIQDVDQLRKVFEIKNVVEFLDGSWEPGSPLETDIEKHINKRLRILLKDSSTTIGQLVDACTEGLALQSDRERRRIKAGKEFLEKIRSGEKVSEFHLYAIK